ASTTQPSAIGSTLTSATGVNAPQAAATATAPPSTANPFTGASGGATLPGGLMIQADTANNALIIMGPEPLYNNLRAIIERLDVRRAQGFVEPLMVEAPGEKT